MSILHLFIYFPSERDKVIKILQRQKGSFLNLDFILCSFFDRGHLMPSANFILISCARKMTPLTAIHLAHKDFQLLVE